MTAISTFGANLRAARLKARLTQEDLRARLGFKRTTPISVWERGTHLPSAPTILKLAAAIGCTPAALLRNVVTPYDALRGHAKVALDVVLTPPPQLTEDEARLLTVARRLPKELFASHLTLMEEQLRHLGEISGALDGRFREASARRPRGSRARAARVPAPARKVSA